MFVFTYLL